MQATVNLAPEIVSVVVPTYHRPDRVRAAVASILEQDLPPGWELEVVIAVSDPAAAEDRAAAADLCRDPHVVSVEASSPGPGAARNVAMAKARGSILAFIDDDCRAAPGWLRHGLEALAGADLVQGRTEPDGEVPYRYDHSQWIDPPSWLWETCNLFVTRAAADRGGAFDEGWNPTGVAGDHWGEDTEWGWRVIRAGARWAAAPRAVVLHAVEPRTFAAYLRYKSKLRFTPELLAVAPESRRRYFAGYFISRRHASLLASAGLAGVGLLARRRGAPRVATALELAALAGYLYPVRWHLGQAFRQIAERSVIEAVEFGSLAYGSVRARRVLL